MKEDDDASRKRLDLLNQELTEKEREYNELEEVWKAEKAALAGTQHIKAARAGPSGSGGGAPRRGLGPHVRAAVRPHSRAGETAGSRHPGEMQETSLLRNRVTDVEIADVLAAGPAFRWPDAGRGRRSCCGWRISCTAG